MNISLIGMPASGKTSVSKELKKLFDNYNLIDIDEKIVHNEKSFINDIFKTKGEEYFRALETNVLKEILKNDNQIISTGGGIVKKTENIELLKKYSIVVYLNTEIKTLIERAEKNTDRPLLNNCDVREKMEILLSERKDKYEKAHYIINTENKTVKEIANEISGIVNEYGRS